MFSLILSLLAGMLGFGAYRVLQIGKRDPRIPKGPPTVPILGNFHQIPEGGLFKQYVLARSSPQFPFKLTGNSLSDSKYGLRNMGQFFHSKWAHQP
jgi:hypothetical protein